MSITKEQIIETIAAMSVMDVVELTTAMEKKFGISTTADINSTKVNNNLAETTEEKTEFNVILKAIGTNKISVIKAVRSVTNLGLKEAKDLVESVPVVLKEDLSKSDADALKKALEDAGAEIEIK